IFGLAALSLIVGLVGLMLQSARENRGAARESDRPALHVYRRVPCAVDRMVVDKLAQAVGILNERVKEKNWQIDREASRRHMEQAQRRLKQGDLTEAFREQCRALLVSMQAIGAQRNKEEAFKPLWDRAQVG